jgi:cell division protein FtsW (lipid II flippase)
MDKLGLVLLVFSFVCFCLAAWQIATVPNYYRLLAFGLAFLVAAILFGNIGTVFKNAGRRAEVPRWALGGGG